MLRFEDTRGHVGPKYTVTFKFLEVSCENVKETNHISRGTIPTLIKSAFALYRLGSDFLVDADSFSF